MTVFAKNKNAVAICNRSGQKMMRSDMIEDGYLRGLLVHPDWYDPYHPQERPFDPDEGIAIYRPAPDLMPIPPGPSLLVHSVTAGASGFANVNIAITQTNPPGSTVTRWEMWRSVAGQNAYSRVAFQLPAAPSFIPAADLIKTEALNQVPTGVVSSANIGQQFATIIDTTAVLGSSYQYYVVTDTADTSNTQSPNQFPNGLQSAPTFINAAGQTVSGTPTTTPGGQFTPKTVIALQGAFIAPITGTKYLYSADGLTWSSGTVPNSAANAVQAAYGGAVNKLWVYMGAGQNYQTSPDGVNWTSRAMPTNSSWQGVTWSPTLNLFVATANSGANPVATSPDGITWTQRTAPTVGFPWVGWFSRFNVFIAGTSAATGPMTSPDGINWTQHAVTTGAGTAIYDFGSAFDLILYNPGTQQYNVSPDSVNWTSKALTAFPGAGPTAGALYSFPGSGFVHANVPFGGSSIEDCKTSAVDINSGWTVAIPAQAIPGQIGNTTFSLYSPALGAWIILAGSAGANTAQIITTFDGVHWSLSNTVGAGFTVPMSINGAA